MKGNITLAMSASLLVLFGLPIIFLVVSLLTGEWRYLFYSLPSSFCAGFTGLIITIQQIKKDKPLTHSSQQT
jgi:hypothetical protein